MKHDTLRQLVNLYKATSKHSKYQILSPRLARLLGETEIQTNSRHENERFDFIKKHVSFHDKTVLDVGGNTGYFTFQSIESGAKCVHYYEGNPHHSEFVQTAASALQMSPQILVCNQYLNLAALKLGVRYDICFLLNVLHHFGDDYGDADTTAEKACEHIIKSLRNLSGNVDCLVFQLGFNWKGDRKRPIFQKGTKQEMINLIEKGISGVWKINVIGVAEKSDAGVVYKLKSPENLPRNDALGEFLNRPIFILDSLLAPPPKML